MIMKRSPREGHPERSTGSTTSPRRTNSPESKEERLLTSIRHHDDDTLALANASAALAERNTLLSLRGASLTDIRRNNPFRLSPIPPLQGLTNHQGFGAAAGAGAAGSATTSSIENQLQALSNQQLISDRALRLNREHLRLQLLMGGGGAAAAANTQQATNLAAASAAAANSNNPFSLLASSGNSTDRTLLEQMLSGQAARTSGAPAPQIQAASSQAVRRDRSYDSLPSSFPNTLSELEQHQLRRLSQLQASASAPLLPLSASAHLQGATSASTTSNVSRVNPTDLLRLSNMGANTSSSPAGEVLRGMLLPRSASSTAAGGALATSGTPGVPTTLGVPLPLGGLREQQLTHQLSEVASASTGLTARDIVLGRALAAPGLPQQQQQQQDQQEEHKTATPKKRKSSSSSPTPAKAQRRRRSRDPVVIQGVPHHTEREFCSLGIDEDPNWLSEFQCFVRSELMEVIQASQSDVLVRSTSKSIQPEQVGVRCRYCAHLSPGSRISRSSAFPSSLDKLYQSFSMMVRDHFGRCPEVPPEKAREFQALKGQNAQGATDSKQYWVYAAQKLGMMDAASGIERPEASQLAAQQLPPYGATSGETLTEEGEESVSLVVPDDAPRLTPFLYLLMQHLQLVHLLASERVGKRKGLPVGLEGLGCKYCCRKGRLGFSRCFPLRRRALPSHMYDLYRHCLRCPLCPADVKQQLQQAHAAGANTNDGSGANHSKEMDSYAIVWAKLGRQRDLTTS